MRRFAPKLLLLLFTLVSIAGVGEVIARFSSASPSPLPGSDVLDSGPSGLPVLRGVDEISRRNVRGVFLGTQFRTNKLGLRGPELEPRAAEGTFRILISGDSVTLGWGVEEQDAFPKVLERLLNGLTTKLPGAHERFEVINAGRAAVNSRTANQRLVGFGEKLGADLTIYAFTVNDIEGPRFRKSRKRVPEEEQVDAWRNALRFRDSRFHLLREIWPRLMLVLDTDSLIGHGVHGDPESLDWYKNYFENPHAWADFVDGLDRHAFYAETREICANVLVLTHMSELRGGHRFLPIYQRVAKAARQRGLHVSETFSYFEDRDDKELRVTPFDSHPNRAAHEIIAAALFDGLLALPPECWLTPRQRAATRAGETSWHP